MRGEWKIVNPEGEDIRKQLQVGEILYGTPSTQPQRPEDPSPSKVIEHLRRQGYQNVRAVSLEGYRDPVGHLDKHVAIVVKPESP